MDVLGGTVITAISWWLGLLVFEAQDRRLTRPGYAVPAIET